MSQQPPARAVYSHILPPLAQPRESQHPAPSLGVSQATVQRALANPRTLAPSDILQLQSTIGNQAVQRMLQRDSAEGFEASKGIQTKLRVGAANDRYEQEADHVATQVTQPRSQVSASPPSLKTAIPHIQRESTKKNKSKSKSTNPKQQITFNGQKRSIESEQDNPFAFQVAIPEMAVKGVKSVPDGQQPKAVMLMGPVGAGKSLLIPQLVPDRSNFVHADADMVKEAMPEYQAGVAKGDKNIATKIHKTSKASARGIANKAIQTRCNLLFDASGGDLGEYQGLMSTMRKVGYHITLAMTHISVDEGLKRVAARAQVTGRDIPQDIVRDMYHYAPLNFPQLVPLVDQAYLFDNMVPQGEPPHLIWESKDGPQIAPAEITHLTELLANISKKTQKDIPAGKVDNSDVDSQFKVASNVRYLGRDGWAYWIDRNNSSKYGLTSSRKELRGIDKNLKKYDQYKSKSRGNAQEQAQLLFQMQNESKNSRYQLDSNKNTKTFNRRRSATSRLLQEIDGELKSNPARLAKVGEAEQSKELVRVGFSTKFLSSILKLDLRLLYQAHAALAHHQVGLAQSIFDRLNPVERDANKKLQYGGNYIKRSRSEMHLAQQMITAHHQQTIGGAYASMFTATPMDDTQLQKATTKYVRNKDFVGQGMLDIVKNKGIGAKSLDELVNDNTGLLPQEIEAIRMYSSSIYQPMNATMQDIRLDDPKAQKDFKGYSALNQLAMSGLSKLPKYIGTEVWRGDRAFSGMLNTLRSGTLYQTPSFLSTTKNKTFATTGANIGWIIKVASNSRGKDIENISVNSKEGEVLFPPGTKLKITYVVRRVFSPLDTNLKPEHVKRDDEDIAAYQRRMYESDDGKKMPDDKLQFALRANMRALIYAEEV